MEQNIASIIVKIWTLTKSWCPNFVQAEEMRWINKSIDHALRENARRNELLHRYREALESIYCNEDPASPAWKTADKALHLK